MIKFLKPPNRTAIRTVDLSQPLHPLTDVLDYTSVRVFVTLDSRLLGSVQIANHHQPIGASRLCSAIVETFVLKLAEAFLVEHYLSSEAETARLSPDAPVSVVVATRDRPDDLRDCLRCLVAQVSPRRVEIVVVDNNPESGLTPPVVAEFPGVVLVNEQRKGLAYARNKGFIKSTGDIVVATDDDVRTPSDWLEKLIAPFARTEVMAVTGNVLPLELETLAQHLFEAYGGLGRGFNKKEVDRHWFSQFVSAVPTWELGGTANAAFRATIFNHPQIGLIDEALGAGMPSGCSEDTYLFYKILKAGFVLVYEPAAYVWHKHRREMSALRHQIYNYSKGHVAYHLTTLMCDRDWRALVRLAIKLPRVHLWKMKTRLSGSSEYPLSLVLLEIAGALAGPWALWQSHRRVKRQGRSEPYVPVSKRRLPSSPTVGTAGRLATMNVCQ